MPLLGGAICQTLVTSRALDLKDELPNATQIILDTWSVAEGLEFLRRRCERLRSVSRESLYALVDFVGCLPLGVRLVASFLIRRPSLSAEAALVELRQHPLGVLERYRGSHPGVVATFQASWDALGEHSRRVLQALAVCARRTQVSIVEAIAGVGRLSSILDGLAVQSLVEYHVGAEAPWGVHDIIRMFASAQEGYAEQAAAHLAWVEAHLMRTASPTLYRELDRGVAEVIQAVTRLIDCAECEHATALYEPLVEHLRRVGRLADVVGLTQRLLQSCPNDSTTAASCHLNLAVCWTMTGQISAAVASFSRALLMFEAQENLGSQATTLIGLGNCRRLLGEIHAAISLLDRALIIERIIDAPHVKAMIMGNLGVCHMDLGETDRAIDLLLRALVINEQCENLETLANDLGNLGMCYLSRSDYAKAHLYFQRALALDETLGRTWGIASHLGNLGLCFRHAGDIDRAIEYHQRALALDRRVGYFAEGGHLRNLAACYKIQERFSEATACYRHALLLEERLERATEQFDILLQLSDCYKSMGELDSDVLCLERALAVERSLAPDAARAKKILTIGLRCADFKRYDVAIVAYERALLIQQALGHIENQCIAMLLLSMVHELCDHAPQAIQYVVRIIRLFQNEGIGEDDPSLVGAVERLISLASGLKAERC